MERKIVLLLGMLGMLFGLNSCFHEADLTVSREDEDWYVLENSEDELDHLRYLIYEEYGVPVYYNDTIGSRIAGTDIDGNPVIYYEVLNPNYNLTNTVNDVELSFCENRDRLIAAMNFMRDEVLPLFCTKDLLPRCFLLVDTVYVACSSESLRYEDYVYRSMMTTVIGYVDRLEEMSAQERERMIKRIVAEEWGVYLTEYEESRLQSFYTISEVEVYSRSTTYEMNPSSYGSGVYIIPYKEWGEYGFLDYDHWKSYSEGSSYFTPDKLHDVVDYVTEVLIGDDAAFEAQWGDYDWVLQKYEIMKGIVEEVTADLSK